MSSSIKTHQLSRRGRFKADPWFRRVLALAGTSVLIILAAMLISTAVNAWPVFMHAGLSFVTSSDWDPGISRTEITGDYGRLLSFWVH
ncbi:MAG: hypothetical protein P8046_07660 [Anaerolineales bacterium]